MERFEIVIGDRESDTINLNELVTFLSGFQKAYELAYWYSSKLSVKPSVTDFRIALTHNHKALLDFNPSEIDQIDFTSISTNSPLKFIGYCTGTSILALSLAVAIAGGDADLKNRTFKVNSLGDAGIRIYKALSDDPENSGPNQKNMSKPPM